MFCLMSVYDQKQESCYALHIESPSVAILLETLESRRTPENKSDQFASLYCGRILSESYYEL